MTTNTQPVYRRAASPPATIARIIWPWPAFVGMFLTEEGKEKLL